MKSKPQLIGITLGDVNGIGPEVALQAAFRTRIPNTRWVLIGSRSIIDAEAKRLGQSAPPSLLNDNRSRVVQWDPTPDLKLKRRPGRCQTDAALAAAAWIDAAVQSTLNGRLQAIVTAPINKEGLMKAGLPYAGHTEMLAHLTDSPHVDMMLLSDTFRVVLATRHIPIRAVAASLTVSGLQQTIKTTITSLNWLGAKQKRIAVCGLNPHAGDGGRIGDEEARIIAPALQAARRAHKQVKLTGPVPADTVFYHVRKGLYDAVIAMYHDQALAPFKMVAFEKGVNLTLGLPIVRTSPDHGTAYAIAGKQCADPSSMIAALKLAAHLARRPNPWRRAS